MTEEFYNRILNPINIRFTTAKSPVDLNIIYAFNVEYPLYNFTFKEEVYPTFINNDKVCENTNKLVISELIADFRTINSINTENCKREGD